MPTSEGFGALLGAVIPDEAIVVDEAITFGTFMFPGSYAARPHDWMMVTGGAIGYGMPAATGAAVAGNGRRVINVQPTARPCTRSSPCGRRGASACL